jgi:ABC-type multidrug transport system ATPase subunit
MELTIRNVSKTYPGDVKALDDLSLTIPTGMFGLLGPNGAGKTTLMRSIATLQEVDAGTIHLGATDVLREKDAVRRVLGYLPQDFGLYPNVRAETLLHHFAVLKGITAAGERRAAVEALLQATNLWAVRRKNLGEFSGGMRQRFGIAQALLGAPRLIIVDEPTAGLDPEERTRFLDLLSAIGENVIVILSTHIVDDVSQVCSRMAIIDRGRVLMTGDPQAAIAEMRGRTWRRTIERSALPAARESYDIISTRLAAGRTVVHVYKDGPPDASFEPVPPDLRDVYFRTLAGTGGER